jgi:hypothetical protein
MIVIAAPEYTHSRNDDWQKKVKADFSKFDLLQ